MTWKNTERKTLKDVDSVFPGKGNEVSLKKTSKENTSIVEFTATDTLHIHKDEIFMDLMQMN